MLTRRHFLLAGGAAAAAVSSSPAEATIVAHRDRSVFLHNCHTGESLKAVYFADGQYQPETMRKLDRLLRDHYSDEVHHMDPRLIDLLWKLQSRFGSQHPLEVYSAYRSPQTNAWLAQNGEGVAAHSLHMKGMAADIRMSGIGLRSLRHSARALQLGGVGSYRSFVHVDVGRVRYW